LPCELFWAWGACAAVASLIVAARSRVGRRAVPGAGAPYCIWPGAPSNAKRGAAQTNRQRLASTIVEAVQREASSRRLKWVGAQHGRDGVTPSTRAIGACRVAPPCRFAAAARRTPRYLQPGDDGRPSQLLAEYVLRAVHHAAATWRDVRRHGLSQVGRSHCPARHAPRLANPLQQLPGWPDQDAGRAVRPAAPQAWHHY